MDFVHLTGSVALNWLENGFYLVSRSAGCPFLKFASSCIKFFADLSSPKISVNSLYTLLKSILNRSSRCYALPHLSIEPRLVSPAITLALTTYTSCPFLHHLFCCSNTIKVTTVCGHNLTKLGVHPRNINFIPSCRRASFRI
jgi:hypothetical protein